MGRLEGLFSVQCEPTVVHDVALVTLLRLRGLANPWGEERMTRVKRREEGKGLHMIRIGDIEGMAHLPELEANKVWLVNNRIDLAT